MCCMLCVIKSPKKSLLGGPRLPKLQPFVLKIPRASGIVYVLGLFFASVGLLVSEVPRPLKPCHT